MLQPADAAVVRRDPWLPGLAVLLDPERLHAALTSIVGDRHLSPPTIEYVRYKPGQSCLAACRTEVAGREVAFSVKAYRPDAAAKLQKPFERTSVRGPLGPGRVRLDRGIVVSVFPNDLRLTTLARLDAAALVASLRRRAGCEARPGDSAATIDTLRYNPERRFVGRLIAGGEAVASVRCYARAGFERAWSKARALKSRGPLRLARALKRTKRLRLVLLEWLDGDLLHDAIREGAAPSETMRAVGAALAELHAQRPRALPHGLERCHPAALASVTRDLALLDRDLARQVRPLGRRLSERLAAPEAARPIHGDFHAQQVLLQDARVAFLDLDQAAWGDPAADLGSFGADLERSVIAGALGSDRAGRIMDDLLEGYRLVAGRLPSHLNLHVAVQLLRVSPHPFRRREAGWNQTIAALLDRAESFLQADLRAERIRTSVGVSESPLSGDGVPAVGGDVVAAGRSPTPSMHVTDPLVIACDSRMPFLVHALDPSAMAGCLAGLLAPAGNAGRVEVRSITVKRYKPNRRCVIEYVLDLHGAASEIALVAKCRARGTDVATHALVRDLWQGSFGPGARDDIFVPEPMGTLPAIHMTIQRRVAGEPLWPWLGGAHGVRMGHRAAAAIRKLHRADIPPHRVHGITDELLILRQRLAAAAEAHPAWARRIAAVVEGCERLARRMPASPTCGIHRDFYADQLLSDGERLWLVDLDLYSQGDAALDVGNFAAHIDEYAMRQTGPRHPWEAARGAFVDRYLELSAGTTREAVEIYATLSLARHIAISMRFPERRPITEALLISCEERLAGAGLAESMHG